VRNYPQNAIKNNNMPNLKFTIAADWQEVVKLKMTIDNLKASIADLKSGMSAIDVNKNPLKAKELSSQLSEMTSKLRENESEVTKYGVKIGTDLKSRIYSASQTVNTLSGEIIKQKDIIRETKDDVERLSAQYKSMGKWNYNSNSVKSQLNQAKAALSEQKYALGDLQSEQARAKLSVQSLNDEFKVMGTDSSASVGRIADQFRRLSTMTVAGLGIKDAIGQIISVRGDFENIETSIGVLLDGNKAKTQEVMNEIKQYSLVSPLTIKDMSGALQTMMGFGLKVNDSMKYLKALGDISMDNTGKFNSLTLAFSQMSAAGKLMGQDLNQMINAGFNPLSIMAEKTGKSIGELKKEMEKGAISSQMVQQAFIDATSAGGKFYGMAAAGAKTVNGQLSMLKDSFQIMLNNIGKQSEGVILSGIQGTTSLVNNYQEVIRIIAELLAVYGTYKTAVMVVTALQGLQTAGIGSLTVAEMAQKAWTLSVAKAQKVLNATMLANPYVLVATAVATLGVAIYEYGHYLDDTNKKADEFNEELAKQKEHVDKVSSAISKYLPVAQDAKAKTEDRKRAIDELKRIYPSYFNALNIETAKNYNVAASLKEVARQHYNVLRMKELQAKADYNKTVIAENSAKSAANTNSTGGSSITGSVQMGSYQQASLTKATTARKSAGSLLNAIARARRDAALAIVNSGKAAAKDVSVSYLSAKKAAKNTLDRATAKYNRLKSSKTATVAQVSDARAAKESAESTYNSKFGGTEDEQAAKAAKRASKNAESARTKAQKRRNAIANAERKQKQDISNSNIDLDKKVSDAEIEAEQNESNKKLLQLEKSHKDEIDEINKEKRDTLQKRVSDARSVFTAKGGKGSFNANSVSLSASEVEKYNKLRSLSDLKYQKEKEKLQQEDDRALNDFYEKYGTYEEKKLAVTKDYEQKIAEASNEGAKMTLTKQMNDALSSLDFSNLKDSIDWNSVFNDLSNISDSSLKRLSAQLQEILKNNKNLAITDIKEISEKIQQINSQLGKKNNWFYSPTRERYDNAKDNFKDAQSIYRDTSSDSILSGTVVQMQQKSTAETLASLGVNVNPKDLKSSDRGKYTKGLDSKSISKVNAEFDRLAKAESKSTNAKIKETDALNNLKKAEEQLQNANLDFSQKVGAAGEALSNFIDTKLKDLPGLMNEIGLGNTGVGRAVNNGLNAANDAAGAMTDFATGNYIGAAMKGISAIKNVGRVFGIGGGNAAETAKKIDALTKSNEYLKESIDGLNNKIKDTSGSDAAVLGMKAVSAQKNLEQNKMDILDAKMQYSHAHHSNASYWDLSDTSMDTLKNDKGLDASWLQNSWSSFKKLTADQMDYIRTNYASIWSEMINQGKYGDSFKQEWEDVADQAGKLKEIADEVNKSLTQISFDDLYSSFVDSLMDMKKSAQDWADDLSNYMMKAMLKAQLDKTLKPQLDKWYSDFAKANDDDNINSTERKNLTDEWNNLIALGEQTRDSVAKATGYDQSSAAEATKETTVSVSQDSVDELNGRLTAVEEVLVEGKTLADLNLSETKLLSDNVGKMTVDVNGIQKTLNDSYMEIQGIHRDTSSLTDIIKPIKQLGSDISVIKDKIKNL
jgi:tape measure domain-containing protein